MAQPGNHALVVGASSGIGFALAERLTGGGRVTAVARRLENMSPLQDKGVLTLMCDVSDLKSIEKIVKQSVEKNGKITHLIYCAGKQLVKPLRTTNVDAVESMIALNLLAPIEFARLFASKRISGDEAVFCAVSSIAASRPEAGIVTYSVAKAGLEALVKGMARELAPRRAIAVAPGWLETEMTQSLPNIYTAEFKEDLAKKAPRGIATVTAIVDTIMYLLSDSAGYVTGQVVTVDGGASL